MREVAAVVFDFDGVLADTERLHLRAFQAVLGRRGWLLGEDEYFARYLGFTDEALLAAFTADRRISIDEREWRALLDAKNEAFGASLAAGIGLFPGALACVGRLNERWPLGIASGARRAEITRVLESANLARHFSVIVGVEDVARSKPAPDPYREAARRLGVPAASCVAIEDSMWGLDSARAAGLRTVALTSSYPRSALHTADAIVESLEAITPALILNVLTGAAGRSRDVP